MSIPKISVKNLTKKFGKKEVLIDVNFEINKGESLVILGDSGSGKSITIKIISGLLEPTSGEIKIDGKIISYSAKEKNELMSKIGFLFQGGALFDSLKIWENIVFRLLNCDKMEAKQAKDIAIKKLKSVGLKADIADLSPSELSGGMQKRVSLARAITSDPEIIFFDEPTTGLDPIMADIINDLIISSSKKLGATTITITHDMNSARKIADKIAMLYGGKIIWFGKVEEIDKADNPYLQQFINGSAQGPIDY